jgi:hypothetical protein
LGNRSSWIAPQVLDDVLVEFRKHVFHLEPRLRNPQERQCDLAGSATRGRMSSGYRNNRLTLASGCASLTPVRSNKR